MYNRFTRKSAFERMIMCNSVTNLTKKIVKTYAKEPREMAIMRLKECYRVIHLKWYNVENMILVNSVSKIAQKYKGFFDQQFLNGLQKLSGVGRAL